MNSSPFPRVGFRSCLLLAAVLAAAGIVEAQQPDGGRSDGDADGGASGDYVAATELLPDSTAGVLRIPDFPSFCEAGKETNIGQLLNDPILEPFLEAQRERSKSYFDSIDAKVGLKPSDLYDVASGEVVVAWLPFEKDKRRPYSVCVIADARGLKDQVESTFEKIDQDLKAQGAAREDVEHNGQTVRIYRRQPKPGQLKIEEIVVTADDSRVIAADRDSVVFDLIDSIAGMPKGPAFNTLESYQTVTDRSHARLASDLDDSDGIVGLEWFARPFQMGRILREVFEVDRGKQVDILKLLENQGFNAVLAAGGVVGLNLDRFDLLHRGYILAPPTTPEPTRYELGARMLQFPNTKRDEVPDWVDRETASYLRFNWKMEDAFWAAETVINEAFGDDIFRPTVQDIRDDEEGPQIDIVKNVLPNLDDQAILVTDNTLPATIDSERMLVAIRVKDADVIREVVRKAMEVEPDVTTIDAVPGVQVWVVDREQSQDDFDSDLFADFGIEDEAEIEEGAPLLEHWAIALVDRGPGSDAPYLMFSSHPDLLILAAQRVLQGAPDAAAAEANPMPALQQAGEALRDLGADQVAIDRIVRPRLSLRVKYELLRKGELQNIDSVGASLLRRLFRGGETNEPDPLDASTLPPMEEIEQYLQPAGSYVESTDDGWTLNSFMLK